MGEAADESSEPSSQNDFAGTPGNTRAIGADGGPAMPGIPEMSRAASPADAPAHRHAAPRIEGYEVTRLISRGGQGAVHQAVQNSTHRRVAIKVLLESWADSPAARKRFEREVDLVARLKHPHIITVFDSGTTADGRLYYVMDYVRGVPVTQYARERKLDLAAAMELFATICDAVSHAHQKGVIHRDLKPSNILVDEDGQVHVLDFGLAKALSERVEPLATVSGQVLGTPAYMSPEQAGGKLDSIDTRSDVYCLGIILYELLTGRFPYPVTGALVETARHIEQTAPILPSAAWTSNSGVPPRTGMRLRGSRSPLDGEIETIVLKALSKERDRRYQSAGELARDIRHYLAGRPIEARRDSTFYVLRKTLARYRALTTSILLFIILLGASAVIFWLQREEARQARRDALIERDRATAASREAQRSERLAQQRLAQSLIASGDSLLAPGRGYQSRECYLGAWDIQSRLGDPEIGPIAAILSSLQADLPPLMGHDGNRHGIGGLAGHEGPVLGVACLPDGARALSASADRTIRLWDLRTGAELRRFMGHGDVVRALAVLPGGAQFISGSNDATLKLWDIQTGAEVRAFKGHLAKVTGVAVTPDGQTAVSCGHDGTVRVWEIATAAQRKQFDSPGDRIEHVTLSADGSLVMASCPTTVRIRIWSLRTGEELKEVPRLYAAKFLPDSRYLLGSGTELSHSLCLYDRTSGSTIRQFAGHDDFINGVCIIPGGGTALSFGADRLVKLWATESGQLLRTLGGHTGTVACASPVATLPMCVSGGTDGVLKLWDLRNANHDTCGFDTAGSAATALAVAPDGQTLLAGMLDGSVRLWDRATRKLLWRTAPRPHVVDAVAWSADGRQAAWAWSDGHIGACGIEQPNAARTFAVGPAVSRRLAFLPDGEHLVITSDVSLPHVWQIASGRDTGALEGPTVKSRGLAIACDRDLIATGGSDGVIRLFSLSSRAGVASIKTKNKFEFADLAFAPDRRLLAASDDGGNLWMIDVAAAKPIGRLRTPASMLHNVAFLDGGRAVAVAGSDPALRLYDPADAHQIRVFSGHPSTINAMAVTPDGLNIVTAAQDGGTRCWDLDRPRAYWDFGVELPKWRLTLEKNPSDAEAQAAFGRWHVFRGVWPWSLGLLEQARQGGAKVAALEIARAAWQAGDLAKARGEFLLALQQKEALEPYIKLCIRALDEQMKPATQPAK